MVTDKTKTSVIEVVKFLAKERQKQDPTLNDVAARAAVWRQHPGLVAAWRIAGSPKIE